MVGRYEGWDLAKSVLEAQVVMARRSFKRLTVHIAKAG